MEGVNRMKPRDYSSLLAGLEEEYRRQYPLSGRLQQRALQSMVDGGSHTLRLMKPFPPRVTEARGAWVKDVDGHHLLDFWQGHFANLLGHNPQVITGALAGAFGDRSGLLTGMTDELQIETAELLCQQTGAERVRFTTSGSLATMYATMLGRAYTGRSLVLKVGGGWHGAQPWGLKGIKYETAGSSGFQHVNGEGVSTAVSDEILVTTFNDAEMLADIFRRFGDKLACFIVEPLVGAGGFIPATREYLVSARELCSRFGVVLIFDEVVCGFRFRAGDVGSLYGVKPDLSIFGKIIGGGMPVSVVAGREEVMSLVGRDGGQRVKFSGGTYSAHPASLLAAKTLLAYLAEHEAEVYKHIAVLGRKARQLIEAAFLEEGFLARTTGSDEDVLPESSLFMIHFPYREDARINKPEDVYNPAVCDIALRVKVMQVAMLLEGVHLVDGHGAISFAHSEKDLEIFSAACQKVARQFKQSLG